MPHLLSYGNYDLMRGDKDVDHRYGGEPRPSADKPEDPIPAPDDAPYVQQLQRDLVDLGFLVVGLSSDTNGIAPNRFDKFKVNDGLGIFGLYTEWGVREFQIYAKMEFVAKLAKPNEPIYADRLVQQKNTSPLSVSELWSTDTYPGRWSATVYPVSGVVDTATRNAIQHWLTNQWRCPVIVEAWTMRSNNRDRNLLASLGGNRRAENIWLHNEVKVGKGVRMFVRDFTNYYVFPPTRPPNERIILGHWTEFIAPFNGPVSMPQTRECWTESEILPENLLGSNWNDITQSEQSTYRIVRSACEVECAGFFDCLNAWDNCFVSLGLCHWTLGILFPTKFEEGELCGYLAYLRESDASAFHKAIEFFGVTMEDLWNRNGSGLFVAGQRKYTSWVSLQKQDGTYAPLERSEIEGNYFKTWHWFYRFVMAGRTIDGFKRRMWDMARIRLRDIMETPFRQQVGFPQIPDAHGQMHDVTIGNVYTSERAMAMLVRWHIRYPNHVATKNSADDKSVVGYKTKKVSHSIEGAFLRSKVTVSDPGLWNDNDESMLIQGILDEAQDTSPEIYGNMKYINDWPNWVTNNPRGYLLPTNLVGNLRNTRGSFLFHGAGLPPRP